MTTENPTQDLLLLDASSRADRLADVFARIAGGLIRQLMRETNPAAGQELEAQLLHYRQVHRQINSLHAETAEDALRKYGAIAEAMDRC